MHFSLKRATKLNHPNNQVIDIDLVEGERRKGMIMEGGGNIKENKGGDNEEENQKRKKCQRQQGYC